MSASVLMISMIVISYHAYRTNVKWKKKKEEETEMEIRRSKRQSLQYQESVMTAPLLVSFKTTVRIIQNSMFPPRKLATRDLSKWLQFF